ncbi:MAG: hypothetical protein KAJ55_06440 [Anaerolineales bacterium]|nr:hypothetical protein [Anaerolineales bacterium]
MSDELTPEAALLFGAEPEDESPQPDQPPQETAPLEDDQQPQETEAQQDEPEKEPDLSTLLEKAELDPKDFYKLKVPGTEQTFGEAKDALQASSEFDMQKAQQESSLRDRENGILEKAREAQALFDLLPDEVKTPEVSAHFNQLKQQELQRENQRTLDAIPEWRDPLKATSDREAIASLMQSYGFTEGEIGQMYGSRELKAWNDYARLKALVSAIPQKEVKPKSKNPQGRRSPGTPKKIEGATDIGNILLQGLAKGK